MRKTIFQNFEKPFVDIHIRNVLPKLESSRLNGVAIIVKIHTYSNTHTAEIS